VRDLWERDIWGGGALGDGRADSGGVFKREGGRGVR
jgi:hypothetical protein